MTLPGQPPELVRRPAAPDDRNGAFGRHTRPLSKVAGVLLALMALALVVYLGSIAVALNLAGREGTAIQIDFTAFWAAAKLGLEGDAIGAFDWQTLRAAEDLGAAEDQPVYYWLYPPGFHLMILPFGLIGFTPAIALFTGLGIVAWYAALGHLAGAGSVAGKLALAAPATGFTLLVGNTSLLWSAGLMAALACLAKDRPTRAGGFIALLTLKPQLGPVIVVALIASGHWRAILAASGGAALLAALGLAAFGPDYWRAFFAALIERSTASVGDPALTETMVTWYAFARQMGALHGTAMAVQAGALLASAGAIGWLWRRQGVAFELKAAALCLASLSATPYAFQYELLLAVAAAAFLAGGGLGRSAAGRCWLAALWLLPVPGWIIPGLHAAHYAAPAISLSVGLCVLLTSRRPGATAG